MWQTCIGHNSFVRPLSSFCSVMTLGFGSYASFECSGTKVGDYLGFTSELLSGISTVHDEKS